MLSELEKEPVIEPETVHITFTVAECGEFHNMGEYHEGIETIEEAMKLYNAIDPSRMHGIPSIGVNMHIEGTEEWEDEHADIVSGKRIDVDFLNYTPELRDTPKVQDAIKKLIAAYPEKDVIDMETKEQKIQTLAEYWTLAQRRHRILLVADLGGSSAEKILFDYCGLSGDLASGEGTWQAVAESVRHCFTDTSWLDWLAGRQRENGAV